ncbi:FAD:protein FMN transferase [candidate division KSB1 bacterium]|nr:FAD:protein FMN transferase [candidate division KSB1 bacterium]
MNQVAQNLDIIPSAGSAIPEMHRFAHQAMATIYEIFIVNEDAGYAQQAAQEAFDELDRLEQELSRFIENSDISRLNHLAANQPLRIGLDAFECLKLAARIFDETNGAFDVTVGPLMKCWLNPDKTLRTPSPEELEVARRNIGMQLLELNESQYTVMLKSSPVHIDLGAIGKGYAVDVLTKLLLEWDIDTALIHGGTSSVFALGSPPGKNGWPLTLSSPTNRQKTLARLHLRNQAVSGSGLQKGQHIINPRTAKPLQGKHASWAIAPQAATTDAISTAFMIMTPEEIEEYCKQHPEVRAMIFLADEDVEGEQVKILRYGSWKENEALT